MNVKGVSKNPFFYFGVVSFVLLGVLFFSSDSLAAPNYSPSNTIVFFNSFFKNTDNLENDSLFLSQNQALALQTPDLEIIQDNSIYSVATPDVLTTQTLGDIFGGSDQVRKDVLNYPVQPGDTVESIANNFGVTPNTLVWANPGISLNSNLQVGQTLVILPVSGISYIVKSQDTLGEIAKTYKANVDDIISFNNLQSQQDIFIGDTLIIPGGVLPQTSAPASIQVPLADNYFIYPAEGIITQGLHYYNAIDLANKCGTPIYAAASGTVQRAVGNGGWNNGMGNYITILHGNGTVTYYGHLMTLFVKSGDQVDIGDRIALMGGQPGMPGAGDATGCHVHFEVIGAQNPLAKFAVGTVLSYK